jgi:hypothetical protein
LSCGCSLLASVPRLLAHHPIQSDGLRRQRRAQDEPQDESGRESAELDAWARDVVDLFLNGCRSGMRANK